MQCKSCGTELPKKAKICPKCGALNGKPAGNTRYLAIIGMVIMLIGGLLPFAKSNEALMDGYTPKAYSFGFMNISVIAMWYIFMLILVAGILLVVAKKEKLSIITSVAATAVAFISMFAFQFTSADGKTKTGALKYVYHNISDLLSNGYNGNSYSVGSGVYVIIIGLIVAIVGVFWDVVKIFKKDLGVDTKYLSNTLNQNIGQKMFYYRGFYLMFLPVLVMVLLFFYWPMLGCRYAFTSYVLANPYYIGVFHFQTMLKFDTFFWQAFRNTLVLSIVKLILNTGAAVIISLLLNEITNMAFKKTVQTIVYLPHFMSWVVVAAVFKVILSVNSTGVVNGALINMGLINSPIDFFGSSKYWTGTFFVMNIWKDTGWGTILFLATLSGISPDLYEAAQIDGANRFKRLICRCRPPAWAATTGPCSTLPPKAGCMLTARLVPPWHGRARKSCAATTSAAWTRGAWWQTAPLRHLLTRRCTGSAPTPMITSRASARWTAWAFMGTRWIPGKNWSISRTYNQWNF